ncbi:MAG TPA: thioesterase [Holosporales bacterium]|nr:thioesterase [Holosporales bacterium]
MSIFQKNWTLETVKKRMQSCMLTHVGIEITNISEDSLTGTMPVDHRTTQPFGILHGGASVVLAESLGSLAGNMACPEGYGVVGVEINANHLRKETKGYVTGVASPIHIGRRTQVWGIEISNEEGKKVCVSRLTLAVIELKEVGK